MEELRRLGVPRDGGLAAVARSPPGVGGVPARLPASRCPPTWSSPAPSPTASASAPTDQAPRVPRGLAQPLPGRAALGLRRVRDHQEGPGGTLLGHVDRPLRLPHRRPAGRPRDGGPLPPRRQQAPARSVTSPRSSTTRWARAQCPRGWPALRPGGPGLPRRVAARGPPGAERRVRCARCSTRPGRAGARRAGDQPDRAGVVRRGPARAARGRRRTERRCLRPRRAPRTPSARGRRTSSTPRARSTRSSAPTSPDYIGYGEVDPPVVPSTWLEFFRAGSCCRPTQHAACPRTPRCRPTTRRPRLMRRAGVAVAGLPRPSSRLGDAVASVRQRPVPPRRRGVRRRRARRVRGAGRRQGPRQRAEGAHERPEAHELGDGERRHGRGRRLRHRGRGDCRSTPCSASLPGTVAGPMLSGHGTIVAGLIAGKEGVAAGRPG